MDTCTCTWRVFIREIVEAEKFQIRTDKKIDESNDIRWTMRGIFWFTFTTTDMNAPNCGGSGDVLKGTENHEFFKEAGVITFLKTVTQLQVWFNDDLEATWIYDHSKPCAMKNIMTGLKFQTPSGREDKVSTHYRYEIGSYKSMHTFITHTSGMFTNALDIRIQGDSNTQSRPTTYNTTNKI